MAETLKEQLERLHLIASGDRDCDMSDNDLDALRAVLMTFDQQQAIHPTIPDMAGTEPRLNKCVLCSDDITSCAGEVCDPCAARSVWTPIASAPLNTPILLFSDDFGKHLIGYGRYRQFEDGSEGWIASSFHCYNGEVWTVMSRPTHWMPLPSPPEAK